MESISINLYNLCLEKKNEIVFVTGDAKTSFRMRQYIRYLNYEEIVTIIEKYSNLYSIKLTQHYLTYF